MSANLIQQLLREHLKTFTPYASARRSMSGGNIWLNANESPYGRNYQVTTDDLNRYPDFQNKALNHAYATYAGVSSSQVISHRGSDESIELLIRSFCEPGRDQILICPPTYGMYAISAAINHNETVAVPLRPSDWQLDLPAIEHALNAANGRIKVVFVCNPSNPLGVPLQEQDMRAVIELCAGRALVVVDEAYFEFHQAPPQKLGSVSSFSGTSAEGADTGSVSMLRYLNEYNNLVVMRTLSKAFGLAGIRVGFTLGSEDLVNALLPVLAPYPLPDVSVQIAQQALNFDNRLRTRQDTIEIVAERELLAAELARFDWVRDVFPSVTNFILIQVRHAEALMQHAMAHGILLRNQSSQVNLRQAVRISVGSPEENLELLRVLSSFQSPAEENA